MVIDTHIWVWWVSGDPALKPNFLAKLIAAKDIGIGVSAISCWEVAKLVEYKKITLNLPVLDWLKLALSYPGVQLIPLTPEIIADSTSLPGTFHKDPADQLIVATARVYDQKLMTSDEKILNYPHVQLA